MVIFGDISFDKKDWHPANLKTCQRGEWNTRMLIEAILSKLTTVSHFRKVTHRVWDYMVINRTRPLNS